VIDLAETLLVCGTLLVTVLVARGAHDARLRHAAAQRQAQAWDEYAARVEVVERRLASTEALAQDAVNALALRQRR